MYKIVNTQVEQVYGLYRNRKYCSGGLNVDKDSNKISLTFFAHLKIITFKNNDTLIIFMRNSCIFYCIAHTMYECPYKNMLHVCFAFVDDNKESSYCRIT